MNTSNNGVYYIVAFSILIPMIESVAKNATIVIPISIIVLGRYLFQLPMLFGIFIFTRVRLEANLITAAPFIVRGLFLCVGSYCLYKGLSIISLIDSVVILFTQPIITSLMAHALKIDKLTARQLGFIFIGFAGVVIVLTPNMAEFGAGALYPAAASCCFSASALITRAFGSHTRSIIIHGISVIAAIILISTLMIAQVLILEMQVGDLLPSWTNLADLTIVGVGAGVTNLLLTAAYRVTPASTLAPFHYLEIPVATVLSILFFGDPPTIHTLVGIVLIIVALALSWRKTAAGLSGAG